MPPVIKLNSTEKGFLPNLTFSVAAVLYLSISIMTAFLHEMDENIERDYFDSIDFERIYSLIQQDDVDKDLDVPTTICDTFRQFNSDQVGKSQQPMNAERINLEKFDVICGRHKTAYSHTGNVRFRVVIEMNRRRYQTTASRNEKTRITAELVAMFRSSRPGGRFLKMEGSNNWLDVGDEYAKEKVSHALRSPSGKISNCIKKIPQKRKFNKKLTPEKEDGDFESLVKVQKDIFWKLVHEDQFFREQTIILP